MHFADRNVWSQTLQRAWLKRGLLAVCLLPVTALYALLSAVRRWLYRHGWLETCSLNVPVIVVGNLVAGGAGKTPSVIAIVELLRRRGFTPGIVSRGYAGSAQSILEVQVDTPPAACGDEPKLLQLRTGAPVVVGRNRVAAGRELLRRHAQVNVLVSDDGLQHHRLVRSAELLVFDDRGIGNGRLLPAGPLREPLPLRLQAHQWVLYTGTRVSTALPGWLAQRSLAQAWPLAAWHAGDATQVLPLAALRGRRLRAAAGLGDPEQFFGMLESAGLCIARLPLPDHHDYATLPWPAVPDDAADRTDRAGRAGGLDTVTTEKDATKLDPARPGIGTVWVLPLDLGVPPELVSQLLAQLFPDPDTKPCP